MSYDYGWEKLYRAVEQMATGDAPLAERLRWAWDQLNRLEPELDAHLPDHDLQIRYTELIDLIAPVELDKISNDPVRLSELAAVVWGLFYDFVTRHPDISA